MAEQKQVYQKHHDSQQAILQKKTTALSGPVLQDNRAVSPSPVMQRKTNHTGLPDNLKSGMENLSGMSLDHVKVHYNSDKPAAVQAHAYAQGGDIHLASGQEKHLPHELGHVVQQMQGKVQPNTTVGGMAVNDNKGLEREADVMGAQAMQMRKETEQSLNTDEVEIQNPPETSPVLSIQRKTEIEHTAKSVTYGNQINEKVGIAMEAWLDPHNPVIGTETDGTSNNSTQLSLFQDVNAKANAPMIRGHLLNHDLGGFAVPENLYPITQAANTLHKTNVENMVGEKLDEAQKVKKKDKGVYYQVKVCDEKPNTSDEMATVNNGFVCKAYETDEVSKNQRGKIIGTKKIVDCIIRSYPKGKSPKKRADVLGNGTAKTGNKSVAEGWSHIQGSNTRRGPLEFYNKTLLQKVFPNTEISTKTVQKYDNEELNDLLNGTINNIEDAQKLNEESDKINLYYIDIHHKNIIKKLSERLIRIHNECQSYDGVKVIGSNLEIDREQLKGDQLLGLFETTVDLIHLAKDWLHVKTAVLHGLKLSAKNTANSSLNIFENPDSSLNFVNADEEQHTSLNIEQKEQISEEYQVGDFNQGQKTSSHLVNINNNINNAGNQSNHLSNDNINHYQYSNQILKDQGVEEELDNTSQSNTMYNFSHGTKPFHGISHMSGNTFKSNKGQVQEEEHHNQWTQNDIEADQEYDLHSLEPRKEDYQNVQEGEDTQADSHYRWGSEYSLMHSTTKNKEVRPFKTKKIRKAGNTEQKSKNAPIKKEYTKLNQLNNEQLSKICKNSNNDSERVAAFHILKKRAMLDKLYAKRRQQSNSVNTTNLGLT